MLSYADRKIITVVQEVIKADLRLADWQLGILAGPAFALVYSIAGIPVARVADRFNRATLLAGIVGFWSLLTGVCGLAQNFLQLLVARMGVGLGQGGLMPTSQSLIADLFPSTRRGFAMSVLGAGVPVAGLFAPVVVAAITALWGWRAAFLVAVLPGVVLIVLVRWIVPEPRGPAAASTVERSRFSADLKWFLRNRTFCFLVSGAALDGIASVGIMAFLISFLLRTHHFDLNGAAWIAAMLALGGIAGTLLGGFVADRTAGRTARSYLLVPAAGAALAAVFKATGLLADDWTTAYVLLLLGFVASSLKLGPTFAAVQNETTPERRATASALFMFGATTLGTGLGPLLVGTLSDLLAAATFSGGDFHQACPGGRASAGAAAGLTAACAAASAHGLRVAMALAALIYVGAAACFVLAAWHRGRTRKKA